VGTDFRFLSRKTKINKTENLLTHSYKYKKHVLFIINKTESTNYSLINDYHNFDWIIFCFFIFLNAGHMSELFDYFDLCVHVSFYLIIDFLILLLSTTVEQLFNLFYKIIQEICSIRKFVYLMDHTFINANLKKITISKFFNLLCRQTILFYQESSASKTGPLLKQVLKFNIGS